MSAFTVDTLSELLQPKNHEDRTFCSVLDLEQHTAEFVRSTLSAIDVELRVIAMLGQKRADEYWSMNADHRERAKVSGDKSQLCYLGTRVRIVGNAVSFEWYRNRTRPAQEGSDRSQVFSTYIKKGKGNRYPDSFFAREPEWAKKLIRETEDAYEPLRKRVALLTTLRKRLNEYVRM